MNVLVSTFHLGFTYINGAAFSPRFLSKELLKKGHKVQVYCTGYPQVYLDHEKDIPGYFYKVTMVDFFFRKRKLYSDIAKFQPDIIYSNGISLADQICSNYARKYNIPFVCTVRTRYRDFIREALPFGKYYPKWLVTSIVSMLVTWLNRADMVFALTDSLRESLEEAGVKNVKTLSNGVNLDEFRINDKKKISDRPVELLYVANIEERKNQTFLLEVSKHLPENIKMNLVGGRSFSSKYYDEFSEKLESLKNKNVIYHGKQDRKSTQDFYYNSHIFVSSTKSEAQGVIFLEAIASGIPIVKLHSEAVEGVTTHNRNSIHVPMDADPKTFADEVIKLVNNPKKYNKMVENCKVDRNKFSWESSANKFIDYVEDVLLNKKVRKSRLRRAIDFVTNRIPFRNSN